MSAPPEEDPWDAELGEPLTGSERAVYLATLRSWPRCVRRMENER